MSAAMQMVLDRLQKVQELERLLGGMGGGDYLKNCRVWLEWLKSFGPNRDYVTDRINQMRAVVGHAVLTGKEISILMLWQEEYAWLLSLVAVIDKEAQTAEKGENGDVSTGA